MVEHVKLLKLRGHKVVAVHRSDTAKTAMPPWTDITASVDVVCRLHQRLNDVYTASDIDVVVVGIFHQVLPCSGYALHLEFTAAASCACMPAYRLA